MEMAKRTVKLLMLFTLAFAGVYIADGLVSYNQTFTSFPWWSVFLFAGIYFGPVLIFEGLVYGILALIGRRKK